MRIETKEYGCASARDLEIYGSVRTILIGCCDKLCRGCVDVLTVEARHGGGYIYLSLARNFP